MKALVEAVEAGFKLAHTVTWDDTMPDCIGRPTPITRYTETAHHLSKSKMRTYARRNDDGSTDVLTYCDDGRLIARHLERAQHVRIKWSQRKNSDARERAQLQALWGD